MSFLVLSVLFAIVLPTTTPLKLVWIMIIMSFGIGMGLGYGGYRWPKFGIMTIGLISGALCGTLVYSLVFSGNPTLYQHMAVANNNVL